jgi:hypothetical protein
MRPSLRKLVLTAHVTFSVGWLGSVAAYLGLAIVGLTGRDAQMARAAYLSMEVIGWFVIVPFSLATLLVGLVESLGTPWGLFRYWWVSVKFLLTTGATIVLLRHMESVIRMSAIARDAILAATNFRAQRIQLAVHAGGGLVVLLAATVLSIYKPWGMTPYGLRKKRELPDVSPAAGLLLSPEPSPTVAPGITSKRPRWVYVVGIHAVGLALLFLIAHLTGVAPHSH